MLGAFVLGLVLATAPVPGLSTAKAVTVAIHAQITIQDMLDSEGESKLPEIKHEAKDICSGFVVFSRPLTYGYENIVVTARHCTQPDIDLLNGVAVHIWTPVNDFVEFKDGTIGVVDNVWAPSPDDDVAFLTVETMQRRPYAYLAPELPSQGELLFVYGMPHSQPFAYSPAVMMQDHHIWTNPSESDYPWNGNAYLVACPACGPGDSGAGVFDLYGHVTGVMDAQGQDSQFLMYPLEKLKAYLRFL